MIEKNISYGILQNKITINNAKVWCQSNVQLYQLSLIFLVLGWCMYGGTFSVTDLKQSLCWSSAGPEELLL